MRRIDVLIEAYGESHQTSLNQYIHIICVPAIFFSLLGLLYAIPTQSLFSPIVSEPWLKHMNLASALIVFGMLYYFSLSIILMICMGIMSALAFAGIFAIEQSNIGPLWLVMVIIFIVGWIGQFIGHKHEGKKPSFIEDIQFLMIGPIWTLSHLLNRLGIKF